MKLILIPVLIGIVALSLVSYTDANAVLMSPLKQIKSGIPVQDVKCGESFVLVIKIENNGPACVKPASVTRLLAHGWSTIEKFQTNHTIVLPQNETNISPTQVSVGNTTNNTTISKQVFTNNTNYSNVTKTTSTNELGNSTDITTLSLNDTGKMTANMKQKNMTNGTSNTSNTNNETINATYIYKLYQDYFLDKDVPQLAAPIGVGPQPELQVNYTVSSTEPNSIKILFIGMSPNSLKVGDIPQFTLTWQNISDKPVYQNYGDTITPLGLAISPSDNVQIFPVEHSRTGSVKTHGPVYPGQIVTSVAGVDPAYPYNTYDPYQLYAPGHYQIMKTGLLNMTMTIKLLKDAPDSWDLIEIIQFNVNATQ